MVTTDKIAKIIELTRDIFGVDPLLLRGGADCDAEFTIAFTVDVGADADVDETARRKAEWEDRVAAISDDDDVWLRVEFGMPDMSGLLPEDQRWIVEIVATLDGPLGAWLADLDAQWCVASDREPAKIFRTYDDATDAANRYKCSHSAGSLLFTGSDIPPSRRAERMGSARRGEGDVLHVARTFPRANQNVPLFLPRRSRRFPSGRAIEAMLSCPNRTDADFAGRERGRRRRNSTI